MKQFWLSLAGLPVEHQMELVFRKMNEPDTDVQQFCEEYKAWLGDSGVTASRDQIVAALKLSHARLASEVIIGKSSAVN